MKWTSLWVSFMTGTAHLETVVADPEVHNDLLSLAVRSAFSAFHNC